MKGSAAILAAVRGILPRNARPRLANSNGIPLLAKGCAVRVLLSERIIRTVDKLPTEIREKASQAITAVADAFGDPHRHRGLGLRKLAPHSYEIRAHFQWRVVFIHQKDDLIAYDVMTHDEVFRWLRGQRK